MGRELYLFSVSIEANTIPICCSGSSELAIVMHLQGVLSHPTLNFGPDESQSFLGRPHRLIVLALAKFRSRSPHTEASLPISSKDHAFIGYSTGSGKSSRDNGSKISEIISINPWKKSRLDFNSRNNEEIIAPTDDKDRQTSPNGNMELRTRLHDTHESSCLVELQVGE